MCRHDQTLTRDFGNFFMVVCSLLLVICCWCVAAASPRLAQATLVSMIVGTLYYQLGVNDYTLKLGMLLYVATALAFANFAEVPLAAEYKKVLYKQIDAGFYPTASYLTSLIIVHLPLAFAEVALLGSIVYWMAGKYNHMLTQLRDSLHGFNVWAPCQHDTRTRSQLWGQRPVFARLTCCTFIIVHVRGNRSSK